MCQPLPRKGTTMELCGMCISPQGENFTPQGGDFLTLQEILRVCVCRTKEWNGCKKIVKKLEKYYLLPETN